MTDLTPFLVDDLPDEVLPVTQARTEWLVAHDAWNDDEFAKLAKELRSPDTAVEQMYDVAVKRLAMQKTRTPEKVYESENLTVYSLNPPMVLLPYDINPRFVIEPIILYTQTEVLVQKKGKGGEKERRSIENFQKGYMVWNDGVELKYKEYQDRPQIIIKGETYILFDEAGDIRSDGFLPTKEVLERLKHGAFEDGHRIYQLAYDYVKRYWRASDPREYVVLAAWIVGTYFFMTFDSYPYLHFTGRMETGKTRALQIIGAVSFHGVFDKSGTVSTSIHSINQYGCTHCIDEVEKIYDTFEQYLLNGYKRGGLYRRRAPDNRSTDTFLAYSPKAFASIAPITPALMSRTIQITCYQSADTIASFDVRAESEGRDIAHRLHVLRMTEGKKFMSTEVKMDGRNRYRECLEPLVKVATIYGGAKDPDIITAYINEYFTGGRLAVIEEGDFDHQVFAWLVDYLLECGWEGKEEAMFMPDEFRMYIYDRAAADVYLDPGDRRRINQAHPIVKEFNQKTIGTTMTKFGCKKVSVKGPRVVRLRIPLSTFTAPPKEESRWTRAVNLGLIRKILGPDYILPFTEGQSKINIAPNADPTTTLLHPTTSTPDPTTNPPTLLHPTTYPTTYPTTTIPVVPEIGSGSRIVGSLVVGADETKFEKKNGKSIEQRNETEIKEIEKEQKEQNAGGDLQDPTTLLPEGKQKILAPQKEVVDALMELLDGDRLTTIQIRFRLRDRGLTVEMEQLGEILKRMMTDNIIRWENEKYTRMDTVRHAEELELKSYMKSISDILKEHEEMTTDGLRDELKRQKMKTDKIDEINTVLYQMVTDGIIIRRPGWGKDSPAKYSLP